MNKELYNIKFKDAISKIPVDNLSADNFHHLTKISHEYFLTFQEIKILTDIVTDFQMWNEQKLNELWPLTSSCQDENKKQLKSKQYQKIVTRWNDLKSKPVTFKNLEKATDLKIPEMKFLNSDKPITDPVLGKCPVASEKTLCCNLQTLDAVNNCGFACSYCSIQSFYPDKTIMVENNILEKLNLLKLNPKEFYHIGTGQSSDSLMWGNKSGILDQMNEFALKNPNVILEFKTKSKNINWFLDNNVAKNIICTWSLNPQVVIDHEEHRTASLEERLQSALEVSKKGILVGFHFHPMVYIDNYQEEYKKIVDFIVKNFTPEQVALISIGTLTFTRPVMKEIRKKKIFSKILQLTLEDASGKFSYNDAIKIEMFHFLYNQFTPFHHKVFFYLCMEEKKLWQPVFGYEFKNNLELEKAMKDAYISKINNLRS